jgi:hypothetical protein
MWIKMEQSEMRQILEIMARMMAKMDATARKLDARLGEVKACPLFIKQYKL